MAAGWWTGEGAVRVELLELAAGWLPNEGGGVAPRDWLGLAGGGGAGVGPAVIGRLGLNVGTGTSGGGGAGVGVTAGWSGRLAAMWAGLV